MMGRTSCEKSVFGEDCYGIDKEYSDYIGQRLSCRLHGGRAHHRKDPQGRIAAL